jgi:hypothetical protein
MSALDEMRDAVKLTIEAVANLEMDAAGWEDLLDQAPDAAIELEDAANEARCRLEGWLETHPTTTTSVS